MVTEYLQRGRVDPEGPLLLSNQMDPAQGERERKSEKEQNTGKSKPHKQVYTGVNKVFSHLDRLWCLKADKKVHLFLD